MDTGNAFGIKLKVTYQILDQSGNGGWRTEFPPLLSLNASHAERTQLP